jgi:GTP-binding protein
MAKLPRVVLVGRTNVGKSTLFNRLAPEVKSIALDEPGVTRDFIEDTVTWQGASFKIVDTGGLQQQKKQTDSLYTQVSAIIYDQVRHANVVVFVVDGTVGVLPEEFQFAKFLHTLDKPVIVAINKYDVKDVRDMQYEFDRLGFYLMQPISAQHGLNVAELLDLVVEQLPKVVHADQEEHALKVAIIGKPNVGKSSLLNALLKQERAIVSDIPGTTREPITERVTFYQEDIVFTDTPGMRRKRGVTQELEQIMVKRSMQSLKEADVVLLMVDASKGEIADQELKLAFYAFEQHKALIVLYNKQDIVDEEAQANLTFQLEPYAFLFNKIVTMNISCATGKNIGKLLQLIKDVDERYHLRISDADLTILFRDALCERELFYQGNRLLVHKAKQIKSAPMTIVMYVNEPIWFGQSQLSYFENVLRRAYDLKGVPVKFIVRKH